MKVKKHGYFSIWPSVFGKKGRDAMSRAKTLSIEGDMKGDGFTMGGTLVVSAGGKETLLHFKQDGPADHVENGAVLKALGIDAAPPAAADKPEAACDDACPR
ncbi:prostamide/prostaglandin F synthase-like [Pollicipes pollicipes]|uniref:prostamide/prostaglandin F synthase-like n=1 Tax=Pollicipes pollicipes TaxID=41117 RepID=UPI00188542B7|nr:prostamide/prostaglandin F synthase-like [Pollicipes pollicipes]XP_037085865.1 prostamide/prostaglandin F synthase-like [Pollicipes pollicipes]